jgi:hypothetical protein
LRAMIRLHRHKTDPDNVFARREFLQIREQHDEDEKTKVTWVQMWTVPSYRKRSLVAAFIMFSSQLTATLVVSGKEQVIPPSKSSLTMGSVQSNALCKPRLRYRYAAHFNRLLGQHNNHRKHHLCIHGGQNG